MAAWRHSARNGLVTVAVPSSVNDALEAKMLEVMTLPDAGDQSPHLRAHRPGALLTFTATRGVVIARPDDSPRRSTGAGIRQTYRQALRAGADALTPGRKSLAADPVQATADITLTREMADRTEGPRSLWNQDRLGTAMRFARERGAIVILKAAQR